MSYYAKKTPAASSSLTITQSTLLVIATAASLATVFAIGSSLYSDEWATDTPPSNTTGLHPALETTLSPHWGQCTHWRIEDFLAAKESATSFFTEDATEALEASQDSSNSAAVWLGLAIVTSSVEMALPLVPNPWISSPAQAFGTEPFVRKTLRFHAVAFATYGVYHLANSFLKFNTFFDGEVNTTSLATTLARAAQTTETDKASAGAEDVVLTYLDVKHGTTKSTKKSTTYSSSSYSSLYGSYSKTDEPSYLRKLGYSYACGYWSRIAEAFIGAIVVFVAVWAGYAGCPKVSYIIAVGTGLVLVATLRSNESLRWASRDASPAYDASDKANVVSDNLVHLERASFAAAVSKSIEAVRVPTQIGLWALSNCAALPCKALDKRVNCTKGSALGAVVASGLALLSNVYLADSTRLARAPMPGAARGAAFALNAAAAASVWFVAQEWNATLFFEYCTVEEGGASLYQRFSDSFVVSNLLCAAKSASAVAVIALVLLSYASRGCCASTAYGSVCAWSSRAKKSAKSDGASSSSSSDSDDDDRVNGSRHTRAEHKHRTAQGNSVW